MNDQRWRGGRVLALTGGVGGAKLGLGLTHLVAPEQLMLAVNVADDFEHYGLHVSPDIDTLVYTLAGLSNPETGWGRAGESWRFIETFEQLGGERWFNLGDTDLAMHVMRTARLRAGEGLGAVTAAIAARLGIEHAIVPVSDDPVQTVVHTADGPLAFQEYFVKRRCAPAVTDFEFHGAARARLSPRLDAWLQADDLAGVIVCPSNPYVSIDPVLAVGGLRARLAALDAPVVVVSPIVGGEAIKGPTAKMMRELGVPSSAVAVAQHYRDFVDTFIMDVQDTAQETEVRAMAIETRLAQSIMVTLDDRIDLAAVALECLGAHMPGVA